jgi:cephalosporin hydroxylase
MANLLEAAITKTFQIMYYCSPHTWNQGFTRWMGVPCYQVPLDLWVMQEIIFETEPTLLIETGSAYGGSAVFFASVFDQMGAGEVISIDVQKEFKVEVGHPRVSFWKGMSTDPDIIERVEQVISSQGHKKVMVLLDSDHSTENVLAELRVYNKFVTPGCYLLIHDTIPGGRPYVDIRHGTPAEAVEIFLEENDQFRMDRGREKFYLTFMPGGFLRKKLQEEKDVK